MASTCEGIASDKPSPGWRRGGERRGDHIIAVPAGVGVPAVQGDAHRGQEGAGEDPRAQGEVGAGEPAGDFGGKFPFQSCVGGGPEWEEAGVGPQLAALAPNITVLIISRVLQGAGGAIVPLSISIARDELPRERVSVTVGLLSAIFGIGGGLGIVLAGPIVDHLGWRWLFWLPCAVIAIAIAGVLFGVPESPVRTPGRLDLAGAGLLSATLVALLLAITKGSEWGWAAPRPSCCSSREPSAWPH